MYFTNLLGITLSCMVVFLLAGYTSLRRGEKRLELISIKTNWSHKPPEAVIGVAVAGDQKPTPKQVRLLEDFVAKQTGQKVLQEKSMAAFDREKRHR